MLAAGKLGLQGVGDSFGDLALDTEDVGELAIKGIGPQMRIAGHLDELDGDAHLIGGFLDAAFKDVRYAKLLRDFGEIARFALITLRRRARDHFQIRNLREPREDFFPDAIREVGVRFVFAQVFEWKHGDAFLRNRLASLPVKRKSPSDQHCNNQQQSPDDDEVEQPAASALN